MKTGNLLSKTKPGSGNCYFGMIAPRIGKTHAHLNGWTVSFRAKDRCMKFIALGLTGAEMEAVFLEMVWV
ncbi:MAG: hypothetical protein ACXWUD_01585 [Methylosarcina sp.]